MRCFLGLDLAPADKLAIEAWRDKALPSFSRPVPVANFHVTSVFLGQVSDVQLDKLTGLIDDESFSPVQLTFDALSFWSGPKILCLTSEQSSAEASALHQVLTSIAKRCQLPVQQKPYRPHVTLVRKASEPPVPLFAPDLTCTFNEVHLFESVSTPQGVHYPIRASWPLRTSFRPRSAPN